MVPAGTACSEYPQSGGQDLLGQLLPGFRVPGEEMGAALKQRNAAPGLAESRAPQGHAGSWQAARWAGGTLFPGRGVTLGRYPASHSLSVPTCGVKFPGREVLLASGTSFRMKCPTLERSSPSLFSPMHLPSLDRHHLIQSTASLPPSIPISQRENVSGCSPEKVIVQLGPAPGAPSFLAPAFPAALPTCGAVASHDKLDRLSRQYVILCAFSSKGTAE